MLLMLCVGAKADDVTVTFDPSNGDIASGLTDLTLTKEQITFIISYGDMSRKDYYTVNNSSTATFESAEGYKITKIVFGEYKNRKPSNFRCDQDGYDGINTWTNENGAKKVIFTASSIVRIKSVEVTYTTGGSDTPIEPQDPGYSFSSETATALLGYTGYFQAPQLKGVPDGLAVTYSSSNPEVADVNYSTGEVTFNNIIGETTITASSTANDNYKEGKAQYTLTVKELAGNGNVDNPYSVSDVSILTSLDLIGRDSIFVKGTISSVDQYYSRDNYYKNGGQIGYYISDDGTASNQLKVLGRGLGFADFSALTDLMPGSNVTVKCGNVENTGELETRGNLTSIDVPFYVFPDGYATLYYGGFALKVPAGVTATVYSYADNNLNASKTYAEGDVIPAKTAVVLNAEGGTYYFPGTTDTGTSPEATNLYGYDKATKTDVSGMGKYYMLSLNAESDPNSIGFYWGAENGGAFTSGAHKAFLALPADATAKGFAFNDVTNGISAKTITAEQDNAPVYSITGMRMNGKLPAGIYVKNGKKFVVK